MAVKITEGYIKQIIIEELEAIQLEEDWKSNIVAAAIAAASFFGNVKSQTAPISKNIDTVQQVKKDSLIIPIGMSFKSGTYSFKDTKEIENKLKQLASFIDQHPRSNFEINILSSESRVPNRDAEKPGNPRLEVGQLAQKRADAAKIMVTTFINTAEEDNLINGKVTINEPKILIGKEEYKPGDNVNDEKFTKDQFVNISIKVLSERPDTTTKVTPSPIVTKQPSDYIINIRGDERNSLGIYFFH